MHNTAAFKEFEMKLKRYTIKHGGVEGTWGGGFPTQWKTILHKEKKEIQACITIMVSL